MRAGSRAPDRGWLTTARREYTTAVGHVNGATGRRVCAARSTGAAGSCWAGRVQQAQAAGPMGRARTRQGGSAAVRTVIVRALKRRRAARRFPAGLRRCVRPCCSASVCTLCIGVRLVAAPRPGICRLGRVARFTGCGATAGGEPRRRCQPLCRAVAACGGRCIMDFPMQRTAEAAGGRHLHYGRRI